MLLSFSFEVSGQIPTTNLFLFNYSLEDNRLDLSSGKYLTSFNKNGYNNQPSFINDNEILISSNYYDQSQTDIIKLDINRRKLTRVTDTPQGEYSPTLMPNRREFSVIREVLGGEVNQVLWKYPINQSNRGSLALPGISTVGYHSWIDGSSLFTFLVGNPHQLCYHDIAEGEKSVLNNNPGRTLLMSGNDLYYVLKQDNEDWFIFKYNARTTNREAITKTISNSEDFAILNDGSFIMGSGSKLFAFHKERDTEWQEIADLTDLGINNISRLKVRKNRIILVNGNL